MTVVTKFLQTQRQTHRNEESWLELQPGPRCRWGRRRRPVEGQVSPKWLHQLGRWPRSAEASAAAMRRQEGDERSCCDGALRRHWGKIATGKENILATLSFEDHIYSLFRGHYATLLMLITHVVLSDALYQRREINRGRPTCMGPTPIWASEEALISIYQQTNEYLMQWSLQSGQYY